MTTENEMEEIEALRDRVQKDADTYWKAREHLTDRIMVLGSRNEALAKENEALREALEWYADAANWRRMKGRADMGPKSWSRPAAVIDRGARAKFMLTQLPPNAQAQGPSPTR